jgi:hypothetical protein
MVKLKRYAVLAVACGIFGGAALSATPAQASSSAWQPCYLAGDLCMWIGYLYGGTLGHLSGDNNDFANIPLSGGGNWNDVVSSAFNDGNTDDVALYANSDYSGFAECLDRLIQNEDTANFGNVIIATHIWGNQTFDNVASSNSWYPSGEGSSWGCSHYN